MLKTVSGYQIIDLTSLGVFDLGESSVTITDEQIIENVKGAMNSGKPVLLKYKESGRTVTIMINNISAVNGVFKGYGLHSWDLPDMYIICLSYDGTPRTLIIEKFDITVE